MNINEFWAIVEHCKDAESPEVALADSLQHLSVEEIVEFHNYFKWLDNYAYRWDIWGAAYLLHAGCSDDGFEYFRSGLIAKGRSIYESVLKNPDDLRILWGMGNIDNEAYGCVAYEVLARKQGISEVEAMDFLYERMSRTPFDLYIDGALYVAPDTEDWDFEDETENRKRLPELSNLYYEYWKDKPESDVRWPEILTARTE